MHRAIQPPRCSLGMAYKASYFGESRSLLGEGTRDQSSPRMQNADRQTVIRQTVWSTCIFGARTWR